MVRLPKRKNRGDIDTFEIIHNNTVEPDWFQTKGEYNAFIITPDDADYTPATSELMQAFTEKLFLFPFYIHFEAYADMKEQIIEQGKNVNIQYRDSGRKVHTGWDGKILEEISSFTAEVKYPIQLKTSFENWFNLAFDNHLWVMTQEDTIAYIDEFAYFTSPRIVYTNHDAYGITLLSQDKKFQSREDVKNFLQSIAE